MSNNKDIISNEGSVLRQPSSPSTGEDARRAGRGRLNRLINPLPSFYTAHRHGCGKRSR